ncbi:MAG: PipA/GogA/GtgA family type III secretion system effector [Janthinobacterium lividum]
MLWIKVVSAVESALLFTAFPTDRPPPRARARQTDAATVAFPTPAAYPDTYPAAYPADYPATHPAAYPAAYPAATVHAAHDARDDFPVDAAEDGAPFAPAEGAFLTAADAATSGRLLRALNETGPVPPGWGWTPGAARFPERFAARFTARSAERFAASDDSHPPGALSPPRTAVPLNPTEPPDTLAFSRLSSTAPGLIAPGLLLAPPCTIWTPDLVQQASNLTHTAWQTSRQTLGDDRWASAGIAAWWALRYSLDVGAAASQLHRARSFAYDAFDVPASHETARLDGATLGNDERRLLDAWLRARVTLASVANRNPSDQASRTIVVQEAENACRAPTTPSALETLYLIVMLDDLAVQYDIDAIRRRYGAIWNPSLALRIVTYIRGILLPKVESIDAVEALPAAIRRGIDVAALLFFTVEANASQAWTIACSRGQPSRAALRAAFVAEIPAENRDLELLDQLFRQAAAPERIHYDGISLRNAQGRTFDDLLASEEMQYPLGMSELPPARQRKLLARKFAELNLSTHHPFGSVRHTIATTVERIAAFRNDDIPDGLQTDAGLLDAFKQARLGWADADEGPSSADLLLAGQLASSNAVRLETAETLRMWFEVVIAEPFRCIGEKIRAQGMQSASPLEWLRENMQKRRDENRPVPPATPPYEYQWAINLVRRETERIASEGTNYFFSEKFAGAPPAGMKLARISYFRLRSALFKQAFQDVDPAELKREILLGETWQQRGEASLIYANERMLATFGAPPTLDLAAIAADKLAAAGLSADAIHATRQINIHGSYTEFREPITGSYVDAFIRVCRQISSAQHFFLPSGQTIHPLELLAPLITEFNTRLPSDPWIRVAALETFRSAATVPSAQALQDAIDQHVRRYRIPSAGEILLREIVDIRNLIPFYASSQAIRQGFTEKRYYQVLFGAISLAAEIAAIAGPQPSFGFPRSVSATTVRRTPGVRRGSALSLADPASALCSWPPSITVFKNLKPWEELTRPPERLFDSDLRLLPLRDRRPARLVPEAVLPWGAREPISRARDGESGVRWNGFDVIFCAQEDTVFLARPTGPNRYTKINWFTLQPDTPPEFIRQDEDGQFHSIESTALPLQSSLDDLLLADRPTVRQVTTLLNSATDATPRNFRSLFDAHFDIQYTAEAAAFRRSHPSRGYDVFDQLENAYTHSAIVRRVFHRFVDTARDSGAIPVSIDQGVIPMTSVSRTSTGTASSADTVTAINAIVLPVDRDDASLRYQSIRGTESPALTRTVLHEFFHAWTRIPDPSIFEQNHHRGAVVWLTEAALRQMDHPVYPRIAYGAWDEPVAQSSEAYQSAILLSGLEDRLIEQSVSGLDMFDGLTTAYGIPVERRLTVRQVLSLLPAAPDASPAATSPTFLAQFESLFKTSDARPGATPAHQKRFATSVRDLILHCATYSPLLQSLFAANPVNVTDAWELRMDVMPRAPDQNVQQLYEVNFFGRQVTLLSGLAYYLSHNGIRPLTQEMRILDAAIARLVEKTAPAGRASSYQDRGAVVWLADRVLDESGYSFPKRLHRALLFDAYGEHRRQAMGEFSRARWAAEIEDRYIASVLACNKTENGQAPRRSP